MSVNVGASLEAALTLAEFGELVKCEVGQLSLSSEDLRLSSPPLWTIATMATDRVTFMAYCRAIPEKQRSARTNRHGTPTPVETSQPTFKPHQLLQPDLHT